MKNNNASGFTLVEILIGTVLLTFITLAGIKISTQILNVWNRTSEKLTLQTEVRFALALLTRDLESSTIENTYAHGLSLKTHAAETLYYTWDTAKNNLHRSNHLPTEFQPETLLLANVVNFKWHFHYKDNDIQGKLIYTEIALTLLTDQGAKALGQAPSDKNVRTAIIQKNSHSFKRRVVCLRCN